MPQSVDVSKPASLGLQLVNALAYQLDGTVELTRNGGSTFRVTFRER